MKILNKVTISKTMIHNHGMISTAFFDSKWNIVSCSISRYGAQWY